MAEAGPRKYRVQFECGTDIIGDVIGSLVKDVQALHSEPAIEGTYRVAFACMFDQLPAIIPLICGVSSVDRLIVRPDVPEQAARPFARPPTDDRSLKTDHLLVKVIPPSHPRLRTGARRYTSDSPSGKLCLGVLSNRAIAHYPDFADAFEASGRNGAGVGSTLSRLVAEGTIIRHGRGAYRLPTDREAADLISRRAVQAGGNPNSSANGG